MFTQPTSHSQSIENERTVQVKERDRSFRQRPEESLKRETVCELEEGKAIHSERKEDPSSALEKFFLLPTSSVLPVKFASIPLQCIFFSILFSVIF